MVFGSPLMAQELGLSPEALESTEFVRFFSGDYEALKVRLACSWPFRSVLLLAARPLRVAAANRDLVYGVCPVHLWRLPGEPAVSVQ